MTRLLNKAVSGVKWSSASSISVVCIDFIRVAVLAHILIPKDFGLAGMIMVIIGFAQSFQDVGTNAAIIHRQDTTREQLSSLYWMNIVAGAVIFLIVVAATPLIVSFYNEPRLSTLVPLTAISFLITPLGQQFNILLQKELRFSLLAKVDVVSSFLGTLVAVVSALLGQGVFSIIYGSLTRSASSSIWFFFLGIGFARPKLYFNLKVLKGYISFGLYQLGERVINYFTANVDYLFVGKYLGPDLLGIYMIAYQLIVKPLMRLNPVIAKVAFPVFAKKQKDDAALRRGYLEIVRFLSLTGFPALVGLGIVTPVLIPLVYGSGWELAVPLVQILVLVGMLKTIGNPLGSVLLAKGRADLGFKWNVFVAVINLFVFWIVSKINLYAVAVAWDCLVVFYYLAGWILLRIINLRFKDYAAVIIRPILYSAVMGGCIFALEYALRPFDLNRVFGLISLVLSGVIVYVVLMLLFEYRYLQRLWSLMFRGGEK